MENEAQLHYIYGLADPDTGEIRYVGRSVDPIRRLRDHYARRRGINVNDGRQKHFGRWLESIWATGRRPDVVILEETSGGQVAAREVEWIAFYRGRHPGLFNSYPRPRPTPAPPRPPRPRRRAMDPEELRAFRVARGWSQKQLAARIGVDHSAVSYWESGKRAISEPAAMAIRTLDNVKAT